jgi:hypothetical protein|nr:MAG TPA: hypothetical protein [Caudoviricetes sp.]
MSKNYRYITTTPQEICQWANKSQLILGDKEKRVAMRGDMQRVRSLVSLGLPFPQLVLAEYVDGKTKKYRVVYGAGLVSAILSCVSCASWQEKVTHMLDEFMEYEFAVTIVALGREG